MEKFVKLCPMHNVVSTRIPGRTFSTGLICSSKKSHYDILGVTPKATMADIKKAYYNLSMIYHPDKSDGSADTLEKFRKVTEAYEILSNVNSKKLYDKGVLRPSPLEKTVPKTTPKKKTYVPQEAGKTPIYDFELWTRAHYGETIQRRTSAKQRYAVEQDIRDREEESNRVIILVLSIGLMIFVSSAIVEVSSSRYDKPVVEDEDVSN